MISISSFLKKTLTIYIIPNRNRLVKKKLIIIQKLGRLKIRYLVLLVQLQLPLLIQKRHKLKTKYLILKVWQLKLLSTQRLQRLRVKYPILLIQLPNLLSLQNLLGFGIKYLIPPDLLLFLNLIDKKLSFDAIMEEATKSLVTNILEGIDINKTGDSRECIVCHYWYCSE